jgi:hypothetical protein
MGERGLQLIQARALAHEQQFQGLAAALEQEAEGGHGCAPAFLGGSSRYHAKGEMGFCARGALRLGVALRQAIRNAAELRSALPGESLQYVEVERREVNQAVNALGDQGVNGGPWVLLEEPFIVAMIGFDDGQGLMSEGSAEHEGRRVTVAAGGVEPIQVVEPTQG